MSIQEQQTDLRSCPSCGQMIKAKAVLCKHCKTAIADATEQPVEKPEPRVQEQSSDRGVVTAQPKSKTTVVIGVAVLAVVICIGGLAYFFAQKPTSIDASTNNAAVEVLQSQTSEQAINKTLEPLLSGYKQVQYEITKAIATTSADTAQITVYFNIKNVSKEPITSPSNSQVWKLFTRDDTEYTPVDSSSYAGVAELQPGFHKDGLSVSFNIPADRLRQRLDLRFGNFDPISLALSKEAAQEPEATATAAATQTGASAPAQQTQSATVTPSTAPDDSKRAARQNT